MRVWKLIPAMAFLFYAASASAQGWIEYVNTDDFFAVNFPGEPRVEEFIYVSEFKSPLPSRRYIGEDASGRYQMTVIDMHTTVRPPGRQGVELRGAMAYAASELRRTGEVTYDAYGEIQVIPGHQLQITLPDGRRNFVQIHYHDHRLYVAEAIVAGNMPPPVHFQASVSSVNEEGLAIRYTGEGTFSFPDGRPVLSTGGEIVTTEADALDIINSGARIGGQEY
jgi:hypothetical protein